MQEDKNGVFAISIYIVIFATYLIATIIPMTKDNYLWISWLLLGIGFLLSYFWRRWGDK